MSACTDLYMMQVIFIQMNWKRIQIFLSAAILFSVTAFCFYTQDRDALNTLRFVARADDNIRQSVSLYYDDGIYYASLPSFADADSLNIVYNSSYSLFIDGRFYESDSSFPDFQTGRVYKVKIKNALHFTVCSEKLIIMKAEHIPALSLRLTDGTVENINSDKTISKTGLAFLINKDKTVDYAGSFKQIHGRGNSTWDQAKKSYALDFAEDTDLLGMGAGKNWVLLSNSFDESGLRNKLAYDTAKAIGVRFPVNSEYVDLYIDNVYYGMYLLSQKIGVGSNCVDITDLEEITKSVNQFPLSSYPRFEAQNNGKIKKGFDIAVNPDDITGGYLVQIEHHDEKIASRDCVFQTDTLTFSVTSPKHASRQQIDYLAHYFNTVQSHIAEGDLSDIDLDSFVRYYLIQELFANKDKNSFFFCKDSDNVDGRIYACSIWDLDLTMGNGWLVSNVNPSVLYRNTNNWFDILYENPVFKARLEEMYATVIRPNVKSLIYKPLNKYTKTAESSFAMDKIRWRYADVSRTVSFADLTVSSNWGSLSQSHFDTLAEHADFIKDFMKKRIRFLDSAWIDDVTYCFVSFSTPDNTEYFTVREGGVLNEEPLPSSGRDYGRFAGWVDPDGNEYVPGQQITQSVVYNAKWETDGSSQSISAKVREKIDKFLANPTHPSVLMTVGLTVIICTIACLVATDLRNARKRRYDNGQNP